MRPNERAVAHVTSLNHLSAKMNANQRKFIRNECICGDRVGKKRAQAHTHADRRMQNTSANKRKSEQYIVSFALQRSIVATLILYCIVDFWCTWMSRRSTLWMRSLANDKMQMTISPFIVAHLHIDCRMWAHSSNQFLHIVDRFVMAYLINIISPNIRSVVWKMCIDLFQSVQHFKLSSCH